MAQRVRSFRDLRVWQEGIEMVSEVYQLTSQLPDAERYGLAAQLRRAAVSVPSNIAEGQARTGAAEFRHSLSIALGSLAEVETQLVIAQRLQWASSRTVEALLVRINGLRGRVRCLMRGLG